jgi:hypothetical protein
MMTVHIGTMGSVPDDDIRRLAAGKYEDAIKTLEATQELCQRLDKWAMRQLSDPRFVLPLHDLIQYCKVTSLRCRSYLAGERPLLPSEFVQEQLWRGLGALGFDRNTDHTVHDTTMLALLLAECKRRTLEVLDLLENELHRISGRGPVGKLEQPEVKTPQKYDFQPFISAVTKVHNNTILRSNSQYMLEKQRRVEDEVARQILPSVFAFGNELLKMAGDSSKIEPSPHDTYPGEAQIEQTLQKFL